MYIIAIILALANFIYIYGFRFESLSEEQLVLFAPLWLLLFIFGTHGIVAGELIKKVDEGKYHDVREALVKSSQSFGMFSAPRQLFFFTLIVLNLKNPFLLAVISALIWAVLLILFFQIIFPVL